MVLHVGVRGVGRCEGGGVLGQMGREGESEGSRVVE